LDYEPEDEPGSNLGLGPLFDPIQGLRRHAVQQTSLTVGGQLAQTVLQVGSTMVLARILAPSDFGLIAMVAVVIAFATLVRDLGLTQAMVRTDDLDQSQATGLFWASTAGTAVLSAATVLAAPLIAWFYGEPALVGITIALAGVFLVSGLGVIPQGILARQMSFSRVVSAEVAGSVAGVITAIAVAVVGGGYWALVSLYGARAIVSTSILWFACRWRPGRPSRSSGIGHLLRFGWNVTRFNGLTFLSRNTDDVLVGWRWGADQLGQYSAAYRVLLLPLSQINAPLSRVAIPTLTRLASDPGRYRRAYLRIVSISLTIAMPAMGLAAVAADWIISVVLGSGWEQASDIFRWLAIAGLTQPLTNTTGWLFVTQDRSADLARWGLVSAALTIPAFFIGLPFGAAGVAAAYAISGLVIRTPAVLVWVSRSGPVSLRHFGQVAWFPAILTLAVSAAAIAVRYLGQDLTPFIGLAVTFLAALVVAAIFLVTTSKGRAIRSEIGGLRQDFRSEGENTQGTTST